ncbi:triose-phosphate isomerase [Marivibrio halodurans]|uniref:Triosephosphate isomerase n=1 Tax=Marivibrio halodurans TaxID=2039722 RepID=A0A8J7V0M9_9PROT|nr:triose-phosphate isomerase [Marivibrio halodurans]MBP5855480.1 triose-phosphate isomerase [Marivibrio halodurans]
MARTPLIAGNWKMNMLRAPAAALVEALADGLSGEAWRAEVLICPPAVLLAPLAGLLAEKGAAGRIQLGGQDCHQAGSGAHTGDIAAEMLADIGARHVILGHSERRQDHGETDAIVRAKAEAAHAAGLTAIVCVGETRAERDAGTALEVIARQLGASLPAGATAGNTVVAYEPVWAIGTGLTATPQDAQEVHHHIRSEIADSHGEAVSDGMRVLYGGSMKPGNAADLLAQADIDGGLIGGASLVAEDFLKIVASAD